jgi:hypothetical protein
MFNPNKVTRTHLFGDPRQQCPTFAEVASYGVLRERMTTLVPAIYGHDKAFVFSRLVPLFHMFQRSPLAEFMNGPQYRTVLPELPKCTYSPKKTGLHLPPELCVDVVDGMKLRAE